MIESNMKEALDRYIEHGILPGDFLTAVLENNLSESFGRADEWNRQNLFQIVRYIYNEIPMDAWGSREKVRAWVNKFSLSHKKEE
jgi:hypothetical protein